MTETPTIRRFIKTPESGAIIRVYRSKNCMSFGKVVRIELRKNEKRSATGEMREVAVLLRESRYYELKDCDFCFVESSVRFIN